MLSALLFCPSPCRGCRVPHAFGSSFLSLTTPWVPGAPPFPLFLSLHTVGAPSFAQSAVLAFALGAKGGLTMKPDVALEQLPQLSLWRIRTCEAVCMTGPPFAPQRSGAPTFL